MQQNKGLEYSQEDTERGVTTIMPTSRQSLSPEKEIKPKLVSTSAGELLTMLIEEDIKSKASTTSTQTRPSVPIELFIDPATEAPAPPVRSLSIEKDIKPRTTSTRDLSSIMIENNIKSKASTTSTQTLTSVPIDQDIDPSLLIDKDNKPKRASRSIRELSSIIIDNYIKSKQSARPTHTQSSGLNGTFMDHVKAPRVTASVQANLGAEHGSFDHLERASFASRLSDSLPTVIDSSKKGRNKSF